MFAETCDCLILSFRVPRGKNKRGCRRLVDWSFEVRFVKKNHMCCVKVAIKLQLKIHPWHDVWTSREARKVHYLSMKKPQGSYSGLALTAKS